MKYGEDWQSNDILDTPLSCKNRIFFDFKFKDNRSCNKMLWYTNKTLTLPILIGVSSFYLV